MEKSGGEALICQFTDVKVMKTIKWLSLISIFVGLTSSPAWGRIIRHNFIATVQYITPGEFNFAGKISLGDRWVGQFSYDDSTPGTDGTFIGAVTSAQIISDAPFTFQSNQSGNSVTDWTWHAYAFTAGATNTELNALLVYYEKSGPNVMPDEIKLPNPSFAHAQVFFDDRPPSGRSADALARISHLVSYLRPHLELSSDYVAPTDGQLLAAINRFRDLVLAEKPFGGVPTFTLTSGLRPAEYQAHLYQLRTKFLELDAIPGISKAIVNGRPQLNFGTGSSDAVLESIWGPIVAEVNQEIVEHKLLPQKYDGAPAVNAKSAHVDGTAVDISISGLTDSRILSLAALAGLRRPYAGDAVHYELATSEIRTGYRIKGNSPINLLLTTPDGRRLGYDPATGESVNELGDLATYSGPGSEPQILTIPFGGVLDGLYTISGVGTGEGPFTISAEAFGEDASATILEKVLSTGNAGLGLPIGSTTVDLGSLYQVPEPAALAIILVAVAFLPRVARRSFI